ncbi:MAG: NUDIX domain-containing protein [Hyphomicrobium sp.]
MSTSKATSSGAPSANAAEPRDAASLVLIDTRDGEMPRILMGRRQPGNVFLPNKWVFPGGRCETDDSHAAAALADAASEDNGLTAFASTAVRELFEETGIILGRRTLAPAPHAGPSPALAAPAAAWPPIWQEFLATGFHPDVAALTLLARAITPPGRTRRYDTRFFVAERSAAGLETGRHDGEFSDIGWFTIAEVRALDLAGITRMIMDDVAHYVRAPADASAAHIPFYFERDGVFRRDLIARGPQVWSA